MKSFVFFIVINPSYLKPYPLFLLKDGAQNQAILDTIWHFVQESELPNDSHTHNGQVIDYFILDDELLKIHSVLKQKFKDIRLLFSYYS